MEHDQLPIDGLTQLEWLLRYVLDGGLRALMRVHALPAANNFNLQVPASAVIDGIEVGIEKRSSVGTVLDGRVRIVKGGVVGATDRSDGPSWPTADTAVTYGGSSDLWGETWTAADVNASGFGGAIIPSSLILWKPISTIGFKYKDTAAAEDGIQTIVLRGSAENRTKVLGRGKGPALPDPVPPLTLPVVVQLVNGDSGLCWEGTYDDPNIKKNVAGQFKGKF